VRQFTGVLKWKQTYLEEMKGDLRFLHWWLLLCVYSEREHMFFFLTRLDLMFICF